MQNGGAAGGERPRGLAGIVEHRLELIRLRQRLLLVLLGHFGLGLDGLVLRYAMVFRGAHLR